MKNVLSIAISQPGKVVVNYSLGKMIPIYSILIFLKLLRDKVELKWSANEIY